jgi:hypothetical protein
MPVCNASALVQPPASPPDEYGGPIESDLVAVTGPVTELGLAGKEVRHERLCLRVLPSGDGHRGPGGAEPLDVWQQPAGVHRPSGEVAPAAHHRVRVAQARHACGERAQLVVGAHPVHVDWVDAVPAGAAELVARGHQWHAEGEQQRGQQVALLAGQQLGGLLVVGRTLDVRDEVLGARP